MTDFVNAARRGEAATAIDCIGFVRIEHCISVKVLHPVSTRLVGHQA